MESAVEDVEVHGQLIRAGERVLMWYPSANRDDAVSMIRTGSLFRAVRMSMPVMFTPSVTDGTWEAAAPSVLRLGEDDLSLYAMADALQWYARSTSVSINEL
jgi:hypothetical protein